MRSGSEPTISAGGAEPAGRMRPPVHLSRMGRAMNADKRELISRVERDRELVTPGDPGYVFELCP